MAPNVDAADPAALLPMEEVERRYIQRVLEAVAGNKTLAAHVLGFDRRTLYRKLGRTRDSSIPPGPGSGGDRPGPRPPDDDDIPKA
jgi:two-component system response regulator HydG